MDKKYDRYTMEYYLATRNKEILPLATKWMDLQGIVLREISQMKTIKTNQKNIPRYREFPDGCQRRWECEKEKKNERNQEL